MSDNLNHFKACSNNINLQEKDINLTTLQSHDVTVINHSNNYNQQNLQQNDELCITDRSNSNIFNLSSHDSQSFFNPSPKKKQNFANSQKWIKQTYQNQKKPQTNIFQNHLTSQNINSLQNKQVTRQIPQHANKYYQFALKISKLFNIKFDNLENLYNQIRSQIINRKSYQHQIQQENSFQQSDIMKKLFTYAMKIKSGHNQLKHIIQVIDKKTISLDLQKENPVMKYDNYKSKYFNEIQQNLSIKVENLQEKTKRISKEKHINNQYYEFDQKRNKFFSQNFIDNQNIDSLQTINTIPNKPQYRQFKNSNQKKSDFAKSNKEKSKSSRKSKFSQKLQLIAEQLQNIKNQIDNQDTNLQVKYRQKPESEIQSIFDKSQIVRKQQDEFSNSSKLNKSSQSSLHHANLREKQKQDKSPKAKVNMSYQLQYEKQRFQNKQQKIAKTNNSFVFNQNHGLNTQKSTSKILIVQSNNNDFRQQKSYTYINSLQQLPQQNDEVSQKIHQVIIKSIRSPSKQTKNMSILNIENAEKQKNQRQNIKTDHKKQQDHRNISHQKYPNSQYQRFLQKKQPFSFSKSIKKQNTTQKSQNDDKKQFFKNRSKKMYRRKENQVYLSQQDISSPQQHNNQRRNIHLNQNSRTSIKSNSSINKSAIKIKYLNKQVLALNVQSPYTQTIKVNQQFANSGLNIASNQNIKHQQSYFNDSPKIFNDLSQKQTGEKLSSIYSVQTIPSVIQIEQNKKLQKNFIIVPKSVNKLYPGIIQSSNKIVVRPKSVEDRHNKKIIQQNKSLIYNRQQNKNLIYNKMSPISSIIFPTERAQINANNVSIIYKKQQPQFNYFQHKDRILMNSNQKIFDPNEYKPVPRLHNSLSLKRDNKYINEIPSNKIIIVPLKSNQQINSVKNSIKNKEFWQINYQKRNQRKIELVQERKQMAQNNLYSIQTKKLNNINDGRQQLQSNLIHSNNQIRHQQIFQQFPQKQIQSKSNPSNLKTNNKNQQNILNLNASPLKNSPKAITHLYNSTTNNIPYNFKPPKYIPPKVIAQIESKQKQPNKELLLKDSLNYRPIKTYTQGHLIQKQQSKSFQKSQQQKEHLIQINKNIQSTSIQNIQNLSMKNIQNRNIRNIQNPMLQSQVQYRHDLMQKSTPSFGLQSSHQFFSKSQYSKNKQLNSSRSRSNKKGISLSTRKQKMYNSNFS